jgi:hypothetical protein
MTDQPPSPREVIALEIAGRLEYASEADEVAADALEALRARGYVVVPCKHEGRAGLTHEMCHVFWQAHDAAWNKGRGHYESTNAGYNAMIDAANPGGGGKG